MLRVQAFSWCIIFSWFLCIPRVISAAEYKSWRWEPQINARLTGHVLDSHQDLSVLSCLAHCGMMAECRTVNFHQDGLCELNKADDRWMDIASPDYDPAFVYYRRTIPKSSLDVDGAHVAEKCHKDHLLLNNTCWQMNSKPTNTTYSQAVLLCNHSYGQLAVLDTPARLILLDSLAPFGAAGKYFIDLVWEGGEFVWGDTKSPATLAVPPWKSGEPNRSVSPTFGPDDCVTIESFIVSFNPLQVAFGFFDRGCNITDRGYICQYDPWVHLTW